MVKEAVSRTLDKEVLEQVRKEANADSRSESYIMNKKLREVYGL